MIVVEWSQRGSWSHKNLLVSNLETVLKEYNCIIEFKQQKKKNLEFIKFSLFSKLVH